MGKPSIAPETLEEIQQRVDIVDIISEYVVLHKRGKSLVGLCPFHDEKSPSFSVNSTKQFYHCFGCGAGGGVIKFLMELKKQSFYDVVLDLAQRYQIPLKTLNPQEHQQLQRQLSLKEQLYEILAVATRFYQHALKQPEGENALNYLLTKRRLKPETIDYFQLGYAPAGWETLYRYLVEQKRYPLTLVEEAGLIKQRKSGSGYYDQFRDRLMIPIQDPQGRVIAFGSRTLGTDEPKYLNSPETPLFEKSKTLFALDKAAKNIANVDQAIVVEGYFDAIALHSVGINYTVASLGTAFSETQLKLLLRYTDSKKVIFNFDGDNAGIKATQRAINEISNLVYSGYVQLKILNFPDGKDADEFLNSSPDAVDKLQDLLNIAPLWIDWEIEQILKDQDLKKADQFQNVAQKMVKLLSQLTNPYQQTHYIDKCAEILSQNNGTIVHMLVDKLASLVRKIRFQDDKKYQEALKISELIHNERQKIEEAEATLLKIYLHSPQHRQEIEIILEEKELFFTLPQHRFLWQEIQKIQEEIIKSYQDPPNRLLSLLQDLLLNFPEEMEKIKHLFDLKGIKLTKEIVTPVPTSYENSKLISKIEISKQDVIFAYIDITVQTLQLIYLEKQKRYCTQKFKEATSEEVRQYWSDELRSIPQQIQEIINSHS